MQPVEPGLVQVTESRGHQSSAKKLDLQCKANPLPWEAPSIPNSPEGSWAGCSHIALQPPADCVSVPVGAVDLPAGGAFILPGSSGLGTQLNKSRTRLSTVNLPRLLAEQGARRGCLAGQAGPQEARPQTRVRRVFPGHRGCGNAKPHPEILAECRSQGTNKGPAPHTHCLSSSLSVGVLIFPLKQGQSRPKISNPTHHAGGIKPLRPNPCL